ncbi:guanyl-specific ribonuclease [Aspergillus sclerotialis]|uniref:ribonuclease T1 n=1 Tax=Aspergillus sclerotialis TaxID=2070753 RepID=A0A3A2ZPF6_9EURO|nr:guanyl-specific ribonuclease [Aspergillus sclerotialis]
MYKIWNKTKWVKLEMGLLFALTTLLTQLTLGAIIPVHLESRACAYTCGSRCYTSSEVSAAQHTGCNLYSSNDDVSDYPHEYHKYEGFDFPAPGEYHEFPIMRNGDTYDGGSPGTDRVIFNMDDQLAGVIKHTGASENEFVACTQ